MGAHDLLVAIRAAGLSPTVVDGRLRVTGPTNALAQFRPAIREHRDHLVLELNGAGTMAVEHAPPAWRWRLHFANREPLEVACSPPATWDDVLELHPEAVPAEPATASGPQPTAPLTAGEEHAVLAWLDRIGEADPATIAEVLTACRRDIEARRYFLERAEWRPTTRSIAGCASCGHSRRPGGVVRYCGGDRPDLPTAYGAGHPLRRLPDDQGCCCNQHSEVNLKGVE